MTVKSILLSTFIAVAPVAMAYSPVKGHIMTEWGENIDPENVWPEYPRPTMERADWKNLNGLWEYAIVGADSRKPEKFHGEILVPFAVESALSGVGKTVGENQSLWYRRSFTVPASWQGRDVMLNFGAVDWEAEVWVNGIKVGGHKGGYTPFGLNITPALKSKGENELVVRVWDPTDRGFQPCGKQHCNPEGIWYTPVTGIWQTVWLEPVARNHIASLKTVADIDKNRLSVNVNSSSDDSRGCVTEVIVKYNGTEVASGRSVSGLPVDIVMPDDVKLWSPESPALYDLEISLIENGKTIDKVNSYAAMRKFSTARDDRGAMRMRLNNKDIFQFGPLDQGWWPDGLYTAPSYEAMVSDIDRTREWGFNMIRKHVKVEPELWYAYCDRNGMIVWQDMPNGDRGPEWKPREFYSGPEIVRSAESESCYRREWKEIMDCLYNHPSISTWVPFNEAWGQFKTVEISDWTKDYDPSRLVNPASGGNYYHCGDIFDIHHYPDPSILIYDGERVNVIGEYGGIGMVSEGHIWSPERNWGYIEFKSPQEVTDRYVDYADKLAGLVDKGISGAVYTQTTDVEGEVNGLMTYDRKVVKIDVPRVSAVNKALCKSLER